MSRISIERMIVRVARLFVILASVIVAADSVGAASFAHREVLPNGTRLLVAARPSIPIVVLRAYVRAGSVNDPADAQGLANLTAELLTRGTAKRTGPELDRAIEFVGGNLEADAGPERGAAEVAHESREHHRGHESNGGETDGLTERTQRRGNEGRHHDRAGRDGRRFRHDRNDAQCTEERGKHSPSIRGHHQVPPNASSVAWRRDTAPAAFANRVRHVRCLGRVNTIRR